MVRSRNTSTSSRPSPTTSRQPRRWAISTAVPARRRRRSAQFMRLGDHFLREGVHAKAAASYRKVLKLDPQHEGALLQLVEACAQQGQLADAKTHLQAAIDKRKARGDQDGADAARHPPGRARPERLRGAPPGGLDPGPHRQGRHRRPAGAGQGTRRAQAGERGRGAARGSRQARSRRHRGFAAPRQGRARPRRSGARQALPARHDHAPRIRSCCSPAARSCSSSTTSTPPASTWSASWPPRPRRSRRSPRSASTWRRRTRATRSSTCSSTTPRPRATSARPRAGCRGSSRRRRAISPALLRLVEVCVDGDLDAALTAAQQELAEAYLEAGEAEKARVIAEDLLLRNPRASTHADRLRRILVTLGEKDPDAVIAERLPLLDEDAFGEDGAGRPRRRCAPRPPRRRRRRRDEVDAGSPADRRHHRRYAGRPARDGSGRRGRRVRGQ